MRETWVQSLGWEDPLEKGMAIHSTILCYSIFKIDIVESWYVYFLLML